MLRMKLPVTVKDRLVARKASPQLRLWFLLRRYAFVIALFAVIVTFYHAWVKAGFVTAGDFPYFTMSHLLDGVPFPSLWDSSASTGGYNILNAPAFPLALVQGIMASFHLDWGVSERLLWIFPSVVLPAASTYALSLALFRWPLAAFVSALAMVMNSYIYLLYEGGQFGVAAAYGCMPLILWAFVRGQRLSTIRSFIPTGIFMALQTMYDIRSTYITVGVLLLYGLMCCSWPTVSHRGWGVIPNDLSPVRMAGIAQLVVALSVLVIVNLWWVLPALFVHAPQLPLGYADVGGVRPLSHMRLSNSLSLFHPFWFANDLRIAPINPLFFIAPLLLFGLLLGRNRDQFVLFLVTVALVAAFLVKGDNEPAGGIYDWLFVHLPGFSFFRDPSKFYQPLSLAYALLLGIAAARFRYIIGAWNMSRRAMSGVVVAVFLALAAFPAYPALVQPARGAFVVDSIPNDYARFNDFIDHQHTFFRVLWIPARPRFGTFSVLHPGLDASAISDCCIRTSFDMNDRLWSWLRSSLAKRTLQALSVRYVVVPTGTVSNDFVGQPTAITATSSSAILSVMRALFPNQQEQTIGRLHVFTDTASYPLVFTARASGHTPAGLVCTFGAICINGLSAPMNVRASPEAAQPTVVSYNAGFLYDLRLRTTETPVYLVLQQTYDPHWLAFVEPKQEPFHWWMLLQKPLPAVDHGVANGYANAWIIRNPGATHIIVEYWPQQLVGMGLGLGMVLLLVGAGVVIVYARKQKRVLSLNLGASS